jgi:hypothetical protein
MSDYIKNPNHRDFFSDENMERMFAEEGEEAVYADWMPGVGESPATISQVMGRPPGDDSTLPWMHGGRVDTGRNK